MMKRVDPIYIVIGVIVVIIVVWMGVRWHSRQAPSGLASVVAADTNVADNDVQQCIQGMIDRASYEGKECGKFVQINKATVTDRHITNDNAVVIAHVELRVIQPFFKGSIGNEHAKHCTGSAWGGGDYFKPGQIISIDKKLSFDKFDSGWRCDSRQMLEPIEGGSYN